jgi:hypothetical protein
MENPLRVISAGFLLFGFWGLGWVNIRFFECGGLWFRPYGGSLWQTPQSNQRSGPLRSAPRFGSVFLRSGIHPGASPTVCFAAPPLDACGFAARSLRSHPRINPSTQPSDGAGTSKALLELTLIVLSGGERKQEQEQEQEQGAEEGEEAKEVEEAQFELHAFYNPSSPRYVTSAYLSQTTRSVPSPFGRGLG